MKRKMLAVAALAAAPIWAGALEFTPQNTEVVIVPYAWRDQRVARFAAQEMTNFLSRAFGAKVPISDRINPAKCSIVLGSNTWSVAAGIDTTTLPQEGFAMRTKGNAVYIAGVDANSSPWNNHGCFPRATLFGAYDFLERFVGCRFYFPGELGEIVPRISSFTVPDTDIVSAPAFKERFFSESVGEWYDPGFREKRYMPLSKLRLRMQTRPIPSCHGLRAFKYVQRFGKTHPEYFLMKKDGTRDIMDTEKPPYCMNNKLCFSARGLREEIYQDVKAYLTGLPPESRGLARWGMNCRYREYVDVMPEDGTVHCHCPECTATYAAAKDPKDESNEQIWGYTIDIAERLKREGVKARPQDSRQRCGDGVQQRQLGGPRPRGKGLRAGQGVVRKRRQGEAVQQLREARLPEPERAGRAVLHAEIDGAVLQPHGADDARCAVLEPRRPRDVLRLQLVRVLSRRMVWAC